MCFTMDDVRWPLIFSQFSSTDVSGRASKKEVTKVEASSFIFDQLVLAKTNVLRGFFLEYAGTMSLSTSMAPSWSEMLGMVVMVFMSDGLFVM